MAGNVRSKSLYVLIASLVLAGGLAVRIALALGAVAVGRDAAGQYLPLAEAWRQGDSAGAFAGGIPPLYPLLSGYLARLVGDVEAAARIISIAGGMLVVVFVLAVTRRLMGRWTACVAAGLAGFHPYLCQFSADVGPDSLAAGLLAGLVWAVCSYLVTLRFWYVAATAGLLAGLALTRPEGFAYTPLAVLVLVAWPLAGGWGVVRRRVAHVGLLLVIAGGLCVPRLISVHARTGTWALDTRQRTWTTRIVRAIEARSASYGQWRIWSRGGLASVADSAATVAAGLGPVSVAAGLFGLAASRGMRRRRVALVVAAFVAYGALLVLVGNRLSKRYLLGVAGIWQVWGAIGLVGLAAQVRRSIWRRRVGAPVTDDCGAAGRWRQLPVVAGLMVAALQLPWAAERLKSEFAADRHMGQWMAENGFAKARVMALDPVALWYARAERVLPGTFKPTRATAEWMALEARRLGVAAVLVDSRGPAWCPAVWTQLEKGEWPYGRVLRKQHDGRHTLYLLDISRADLNNST